MKMSNDPKYWDNSKSRALRSITMRKSRLIRSFVGGSLPDMTEEDYLSKLEDIAKVREEIYAVPRDKFNDKLRKKLFKSIDYDEG